MIREVGMRVLVLLCLGTGVVLMLTMCGPRVEPTQQSVTPRAAARCDPLSGTIDQVCEVSALRLPNNSTLTCGPQGVLKLAAGASYLLDQSGETVTIRGCTLDGSSAVPVNDHEELCRLNNGNFTFDRCTFRNVGQRGSTGQVDVLRAWNSSLTVTDSFASEGLSGRVIFFDPNRTLKPLRVAGNYFAHLGNSAIMAGNSGAIYPATILISNNLIEDCQDDLGGTGQAGNAMQIWQAEGAVIQGNVLRDNRFSGVRLAKVRHSVVTGNLFQGNKEVSMYCAELGGSGNLCANNMILDFQTGISSTNQEQRKDKGEPDLISSNYLRHGAFMGIAVQGSIAQNNVIDGAAIGMRVGIGKSYGHLIRNNMCFSSDGTPVAACTVIQYDIPQGTDLMEANMNTTTGYGILPANIGMWQKIAGIDLGKQTTIRTKSGGTSPKADQTVCMAGIFGTTGLNGQCAKVVSAQTGAFTLELDSSAMQPFVDPGGGQEGYTWVAAKGDATPNYAMPPTLVLRDASLPLPNLSGLKDGSDFVIPNAECKDGQVIAGTSQVRVFKQAGRFVCQ